mgnify:CR=1 FL=1
MNNDEPKKKIAYIIYHTGCTGACCECDYLKHSDVDIDCKAMLKASALIAAGIGDVKEAKFEADHYWRMWQGALVELERAEHRAEVAEKQTKILSEWLAAECKEPKHSAKAWRDVAGLNAEKELVEERKDD